jgi:hypothetical protein
MRIDGCTRRMIFSALWSLQHVCSSCSSQVSCFCSQDKEDSSTAAICENPPGWRRMVPCAWLQPRENYVNFIPSNGYSVQAMDLDCRTILGPLRDDAERRDTAPPTGLPGRRARATRRLRPEHPQLGPGTARITLEAGRKNLLRLRA